MTNVVGTKAGWTVTPTNDTEIVALFERIPYVRALADPADGGKVSGSGYCAAGKKVALKARAAQETESAQSGTPFFVRTVVLPCLAA